MKSLLQTSLVSAGLLAAAALVVSCGSSPGGVIAGTALIEGIARDLSPDTIESGELHNLIPPGMCPGHFDVRPADVEAAAASRLVIIHEWQKNMASVTSLLQAAHVPADRVKVVQIDGHWLTPPVYQETIETIAGIMGRADPANASLYASRANARQREIDAFSERIRAKLDSAALSRIKVVSSDKQAGFLRWVGFEVVAEFGRPEDMSVADVEDLIRKTRQTGAMLIVDNLQSGSTQSGSAIARDAGIVHVMLSNFPGGLDNTETWEKAVEKNVDLLLDAAKRARETNG